MLLLSISISGSVDLALAFILLMKQETMKKKKAEWFCFGIRDAVGNEGKEEKTVLPSLGSLYFLPHPQEVTPAGLP